MIRGNEEVIQAGRNGLNRLLVREKYHKGIKVGEEVVQTSQLVRPVNQVVREGTAEPMNTIGLRSYSQVLYMELVHIYLMMVAVLDIQRLVFLLLWCSSCRPRYYSTWNACIYSRLW